MSLSTVSLIGHFGFLFFRNGTSNLKSTVTSPSARVKPTSIFPPPTHTIYMLPIGVVQFH